MERIRSVLSIFRSPDGTASLIPMSDFSLYARTNLALCMCSLLLSACGLVPKLPSTSEPPIVYVWPLDRCPSTPTPPSYAMLGGPYLAPVLGGALGSVALGEVSSTLFGIPSLLLAQAAKADQTGYTLSSTNARFYYTDVTDRTDPRYKNPTTGAATKVKLAPPGCYVVAVYKTPRAIAKASASWCTDENIKKALPETCANGQALLDGLPLIENLPGSRSTIGTTKDLNTPNLYAEIAFDELAWVEAQVATPKQPPLPGAPAPAPAAAPVPDSGKSSVKASVVVPKTRALYYPESLLSKTSRESRSLSISIVLSQVATYGPIANASPGSPHVQPSIAAQMGLLNVNFVLALNAETPGSSAPHAHLAPYPQSWALIPNLHDSSDIDIPVGSDLTAREMALDRIPVNVAVTVHEVGDPSVFLAAFASAMQSAVGDYSKAVVSSVLPPPGTQSLQQVIQKNQATVAGVGATYKKDLASFHKECSNPTKDNAEETSLLDALYQVAIQDYQNAALTASSYGVELGIPPPAPTRPSCNGL